MTFVNQYLLVVKRLEFVGDRMLYIILRVCLCNMF
jgi:hypothetical protein